MAASDWKKGLVGAVLGLVDTSWSRYSNGRQLLLVIIICTFVQRLNIYYKRRRLALFNKGRTNVLISSNLTANHECYPCNPPQIFTFSISKHNPWKLYSYSLSGLGIEGN